MNLTDVIVEGFLLQQKKIIFPKVLSCVNPTLLETILNPTWKVHYGPSKDELGGSHTRGRVLFTTFQSAQDINYFLKEIDTIRRCDLELPEEAGSDFSHEMASCFVDPFELNEDPDISKTQIKVPGACSDSSPNLDLPSSVKVLVPSKQGQHKSRPKVKCSRGPFAGRGRSKVKNSHPPSRVRPPSPPIIRSL